MKKDGVAVAVIPCFNEEKYILDVIQRTKPHVDKVVVADDHSTDDTVRIATLAGAVTITHWTHHRGAGINTWRGIWQALRLGADVIVTLDGDGQHRPEQIPELLSALRRSTASIVIGSRFKSADIEKMPKYRRLGNNIINGMYNYGIPQHRRFRHPLSDTQCGFRVYHADVFREITISERGFNFATEVLIKARAAGFLITEVPVDCIYHADFAENSSMNPLKHGVTAAWGTLKWRLKEGV